MAVSFSSEQWR